MVADRADFLTPEETAKLQQDLASLGYRPGQRAGRFDPRTREALSEFQASNKLPADGIYGPQTRQAIADALQKQDEALVKTSKAAGDAGLSPEDGDADPPRLMLAEVMQWSLTGHLQKVLERTPLNDTLALHGPRWQLRIGDLLYGIVMQAVGLSKEGVEPTSSAEVFFRWLSAAMGEEELNRVFGREDWRPPSERPPPSSIALGDSVGRALEATPGIADRVSPRARIGVRHVLAAILVAMRDARVSEWLHDTAAGSFDIDLATFAPELLHFVKEHPDPEDDLDAWRRLLVPLLGEAADRSIYYAPYGRDVPDRDAVDALGITPDVQAFARLICLKDATPPLSIGLFGDWGSGKSFFMEKLAKAIDDLSEQASSIPGKPFVERVVQIKFNAWHYADANLWASITAEFFDQLRAGGYHEGRGRPLTGVVAEVASRVAEAQAAVARSDLRVRELDTQIADASDVVAKAEAKLRALPANMLAAQAATALKRFCSEHRDALDRAGKAIGQESLSENLDALLREAQAASSVYGKLTIFARSLWGLSPRNIVFYLGTILFLGGVWALQHFAVNGIDWILATGAPVLAGLVAAILALGRSWSIIRPLFEAAAKAADDLASRENELRAERDAGRRQLEQLQTQVDAVTEARKESADFAARYAAGASGASPSTLLRYFLFESEETRAYEQHLGLVSRVRRAFETLNELMREKTDDDAPDRIDRIVLYIDDLDRCRDEQVVQVLEAVHLLLAFDLFVVVVGVDVRWLKGSLGRFYKSQLAEDDGDKSDGQASVDEYLGKIFQIPFWLRPLSFGGDGAEGSYEKLLANVLGSRAEPDERRPPPPDLEPGHESDWKDAQVASADSGANAAQADGTVRDDGNKGETTKRADPEPSLKEAAQTFEVVTLTDGEIKLLKAVGPMAGSSPRAIKRMVNVYRLLRARRKRGSCADCSVRTVNHPTIPRSCLFLLSGPDSTHLGPTRC